MRGRRRGAVENQSDETTDGHHLNSFLPVDVAPLCKCGQILCPFISLPPSGILRSRGEGARKQFQVFNCPLDDRHPRIRKRLPSIVLRRAAASCGISAAAAAAAALAATDRLERGVRFIHASMSRLIRSPLGRLRLPINHKSSAPYKYFGSEEVANLRGKEMQKIGRIVCNLTTQKRLALGAAPMHNSKFPHLKPRRADRYGGTNCQTAAVPLEEK